MDHSLAALRALREAVTYAREHDAEIYAVRAYPLRRAESTSCSWETACGVSPERRIAAMEIGAAFALAMGGRPSDVAVDDVVCPGRPGPLLVRTANRDDDLLVVGATRHPWSPRRSVARYCATRATCPVLVVPPPELARKGRRLHRLRRWRTSSALTPGQLPAHRPSAEAGGTPWYPTSTQ